MKSAEEWRKMLTPPFPEVRGRAGGKPRKLGQFPARKGTRRAEMKSRRAEKRRR